MSESLFIEILEESLRREYAEFDDPPEHKFSLRHRLAMRKIFKKYEKNVRKLKAEKESIVIDTHYTLKQRLIVAMVVIILMTLLTGWFIPLRGITDEQLDWLRSRYDFPSMKIRVNELLSQTEEQKASGVTVLGLFRETTEYKSFLADLEHLGIYSAEELETIRIRPMPMDTRPQNNMTLHEYNATAVKLDLYEDRPIDSAWEFVSEWEEKIAFYNERSKDPARAVEGDAEFAALIEEKYLPIHKSYLELLEKLYAARPDDENCSENQKNDSVNFDKDDKIKLFKINEI